MSKTKVLRYLKVRISKFCLAGHLILIFIKRVLRPTRTNWALFQGRVISQTNALPQFIQSQRWICWDSFLSKWCWGDMSEWGNKKISRGESTMDDAMHKNCTHQNLTHETKISGFAQTLCCWKRKKKQCSWWIFQQCYKIETL